jgi:hypothetical protein
MTPEQFNQLEQQLAYSAARADIETLCKPVSRAKHGGWWFSLADSAWRERIGNAVPPPAAQAIASVMGQTLLLAWSGETFTLSAQPIWVKPMAVALAVDGAIT